MFIVSTTHKLDEMSDIELAYAALERFSLWLTCGYASASLLAHENSF